MDKNITAFFFYENQNLNHLYHAYMQTLVKEHQFHHFMQGIYLHAFIHTCSMTTYP